MTVCVTGVCADVSLCFPWMCSCFAEGDSLCAPPRGVDCGAVWQVQPHTQTGKQPCEVLIARPVAWSENGPKWNTVQYYECC